MLQFPEALSKLGQLEKLGRDFRRLPDGMDADALDQAGPKDIGWIEFLCSVFRRAIR